MLQLSWETVWQLEDLEVTWFLLSSIFQVIIKELEAFPLKQKTKGSQRK